MIEDLLVSETATFFSIKKNISNKAVVDLFRGMRVAYGVSQHNIFHHVREDLGGCRWSALCFTYESSPAFLHETTLIVETLCGYILLVEYNGYAAVFSSRLGLPSSFKTAHLAPVATGRMERTVAKQNAIFNKIRTRNMSISPFAMRSKTVEAADLSNVVGPAGSRRQAPQNYTVTVDGAHLTATPRTGRISRRSDRLGLNELIDFSKEIIESLAADVGEISPFLRTFARPMTLGDALTLAQPRSLGFDTASLIEDVTGPSPKIRLLHAGQGPTVLTTAELNELIAQLDRPLEIKGDGKIRKATLPDSDEQAASLSLNKSRIALRSLDLLPASDVLVESLDFAVGQDPEARPLYSYLDDIGSIIVLFDDIRIAYVGETVFRDDTLMDGGAGFLRYLHSEVQLENVDDEKGAFDATKNAFDATSTFGVIVNHVAAADAVLVCDDLGDEWADFIGLRTDGSLSQTTFYHAKAGDLSLGAGQFHIAVSQAIKNLGNMTFPSERMQTKTAGWAMPYANDGVVTQISRTIRSNVQNLEDAFSEARTAPESLRRAVIVTSSLSKQAVADVLTAAHNGTPPKPAFVQMYWLLQSFFTDCAEAGVSAVIACRP